MCDVKADIKFGTDGWRGVISDDFTFDNLKRVAQAIADYYNLKLAHPRIVVGYDTRFLSDKYAEVASEVLAQNSIAVELSAMAIPTPALSFATKHRGQDAGIMITASHNPAEYNGLKLKTAAGAAAADQITKEVERLIQQSPDIKKENTGKITKVDFIRDYIKFLRHYIDLGKIKNSRFKALIDPMHGSGNGFIAEVIKGTKIRLEFTRREINPSFEGLRPEPVLENLLNTQALIKKNKFDLCLVLDGDADRIACFSGNGEFINPQKVLGLLILHLVCDRKMSGGVIKTIVGTNMLDNITQKFGLKLYETPVGFKYISELMVKKDILIGGEEAGGIGFKNYIPERDGTLAGLLLLEMMSYRKKSIAKILKEMEAEFGRYYYLREDIKLPVASYQLPVTKIKSLKKLLGQDIIRIKDYDGIKLICRDGSWLMFRPSGTEPIIRIYAESKSLNRTKKLLQFGKGMMM